MPSWYVIYQSSLLGRVVRFITMLFVVSIYHTKTLIILLNKVFGISLVFLESVFYNEKWIILYTGLVLISIVFLFLHCILHVFIYIFLFPKICKNSPWNIVKSILLILRISAYSISAISLVLGIPGIDYVFDLFGQIPPLRWTYSRRIIWLLGLNEINSSIPVGELMQPTNSIKRIIRLSQNATLEDAYYLNQEYNKRKMNNQLPVSEREKYLKFLEEKNETRNK